MNVIVGIGFSLGGEIPSSAGSFKAVCSRLLGLRLLFLVFLNFVSFPLVFSSNLVEKEFIDEDHKSVAFLCFFHLLCTSFRFSFFRNMIQVYFVNDGQQKSHVAHESDDDMDNFEDATQPPQEEEEPEIVESDIELDDSDVVEPDNDPPQKVCTTHISNFLDL